MDEEEGKEEQEEKPNIQTEVGDSQYHGIETDEDRKVIEDDEVDGLVSELEPMEDSRRINWILDLSRRKYPTSSWTDVYIFKDQDTMKVEEDGLPDRRDSCSLIQAIHSSDLAKILWGPGRREIHHASGLSRGRFQLCSRASSKTKTINTSELYLIRFSNSTFADKAIGDLQFILSRFIQRSDNHKILIRARVGSILIPWWNQDNFSQLMNEADWHSMRRSIDQRFFQPTQINQFNRLNSFKPRSIKSFRKFNASSDQLNRASDGGDDWSTETSNRFHHPRPPSISSSTTTSTTMTSKHAQLRISNRASLVESSLRPKDHVQRSRLDFVVFKNLPDQVSGTRLIDFMLEKVFIEELRTEKGQKFRINFLPFPSRVYLGKSGRHRSKSAVLVYQDLIIKKDEELSKETGIEKLNSKIKVEEEDTAVKKIEPKYSRVDLSEGVKDLNDTFKEEGGGGGPKDSQMSWLFLDKVNGSKSMKEEFNFLYDEIFKPDNRGKNEKVGVYNKENGFNLILEVLNDIHREGEEEEEEEIDELEEHEEREKDPERIVFNLYESSEEGSLSDVEDSTDDEEIEILLTSNNNRKNPRSLGMQITSTDVDGAEQQDPQEEDENEEITLYQRRLKRINDRLNKSKFFNHSNLVSLTKRLQKHQSSAIKQKTVKRQRKNYHKKNYERIRKIKEFDWLIYGVHDRDGEEGGRVSEGSDEAVGVVDIDRTRKKKRAKRIMEEVEENDEGEKERMMFTNDEIYKFKNFRKDPGEPGEVI
ncbi:expressed protein [Phakopsora pachyrhizi]|uniref:Expressed protein n=1 Tax=Phakopsora pachyrhizi TaxID=170000 RepID=A0AAV0AS29_PHAPC|nr:expressed protein [Phakopsora pachyrhizi]